MVDNVYTKKIAESQKIWEGLKGDRDRSKNVTRVFYHLLGGSANFNFEWQVCVALKNMWLFNN